MSGNEVQLRDSARFASRWRAAAMRRARMRHAHGVCSVADASAGVNGGGGGRGPPPLRGYRRRDAVPPWPEGSPAHRRWKCPETARARHDVA